MIWIVLYILLALPGLALGLRIQNRLRKSNWNKIISAIPSGLVASIATFIIWTIATTLEIRFVEGIPERVENYFFNILWALLFLIFSTAVYAFSADSTSLIEDLKK